jgi:hypothetical protein
MKAKIRVSVQMSIFLSLFGKSFSQTIIYSEDFQGIQTWTLNVSTGTNGIAGNRFRISDGEGGLSAGGCFATANGDKTLYVTKQGSAPFYAKFSDGSSFGSSTETNIRAESPSFSTVGYRNVSVTFLYKGRSFSFEKATMVYNIGSGWVLLESTLNTGTCGDVGEYNWQTKTITLPFDAQNNSNVRIGFTWINSTGAGKEDVSFAVNNIVVSNVNPNLSSEKIDMVGTIRIYPNPATEVLEIESFNDDVFTITNQVGQEINEIVVKGNTSKKINVSNLEKGMYFVKSKQTNYCEKIVIN